MQNIFDASVVEAQLARINRLTPDLQPQWGKMTVDQMLAHLNVPYIMVYETSIKRPNWVVRQLLRAFVKNKVVGPEPYARSTPTARAFKMVGKKDFAVERARLIANIERVARDGERVFDGKDSPSFGPLTSAEWNVLFYKHLDHHLTQFGV